MPARRPVEVQLRDLFAADPKARKWTAQEMADHLGRNLRSVRESAQFRKLKARREGVPLAAADALVLVALAKLTATGRTVPAGRVATAVERSVGLVRKRLAALVKLGYATSRNGDPSMAGYTATPAGQRAVPKASPRRRK
jgi:hypothetical protein